MDNNINIHTWRGYYSTYCSYLGQGYTTNVSWEKTEFEYQLATGGVKRYSSLQSFRNSIGKNLKKK